MPVVQTRSTNSSGLSIALAFLSPVSAGSLIHVWVAGRSNPCTSCADDVNAGAYTAGPQAANASSVQSVRSWYFVASSAGTITVTGSFAVSTDASSIVIQEVSSVYTASANDQQNTNQANSSATQTSGNITTTIADEWMTGAVSIRDAPTTLTLSGSDFTERVNTGYGRKFVTADRIVAATGTYVLTYTSSPADDWCAAIISFKLLSTQVLAANFKDCRRIRPSMFMPGNAR